MSAVSRNIVRRTYFLLFTAEKEWKEERKLLQPGIKCGLSGARTTEISLDFAKGAVSYTMGLLRKVEKGDG